MTNQRRIRQRVVRSDHPWTTPVEGDTHIGNNNPIEIKLNYSIIYV